MSAAAMHDHPWLHHAHDLTPFRKKMSIEMTNLRTFHRESCFRHLCSGVLARQMTETKLHDLHTTFLEMDENEDGILSLSEFRNAWNSLGIEEPDDLQMLYNQIDMDGNGHIDYTEFIAACMEKKARTQEDLCWEAFRVFDVNGNGKVSFDELQQVISCASLRKGFSSTSLDEAWRELTCRQTTDGPGDHEGEVDFDHFLAALSSAEGREKFDALTTASTSSSPFASPGAETRTATTTRMSGAAPAAGPSASIQQPRHSRSRRAIDGIVSAIGSGTTLPILGRRRHGANPSDG